MATIKLGSTGSANALLTYAEKKAEISHGVNCRDDLAKTQFTTTRELYGKNDGIQAHHVIQSFKPGEVNPELANYIGQRLAKQIAPNHEVMVYTHTDKGHIHNHIVINSVNFENGRKYQAHGKKAIEKVRECSDILCKNFELSVVKEKSAKVRYTMAEKGLLEKDKTSWKDEIREVIDEVKTKVRSFDEFKTVLNKDYGIEINERSKSHISFKHPEKQRFVRGKTLGLDYEKESIKNVIKEHEIGRTNIAKSTTRNTPTVDWSAVRTSLENEGIGLSDNARDEVVGDIQRKVRKVKNRTSRATESIEQKLERIAKQQRALKPEHGQENPIRHREIER